MRSEAVCSFKRLLRYARNDDKLNSMSVTITKNISPEAARDIFELQQKINDFQSGEMPEDKFKAFRLTRGV